MIDSNSFRWLWVFFVLSLVAGLARADSPLASLVKKKEIEVGLTEVFVPRVGFDDNDRVELVLSGELPNPCFTLDRAFAEKSADGKHFRVHQIAWKWNSGACATGDLIEDPVPFLTPVLLGQLGVSDYQVEFASPAGTLFSREFGVERAQSEDIDNFLYATVRSVEMEEGFPEGQAIKAELSGTLPSRCTELRDPVKVDVVGNVVIVLPILKETSEGCAPGSRTFHKTITLPVLKPGQYLLHARSRGGNASYQAFSVWGRSVVK